MKKDKKLVSDNKVPTPFTKGSISEAFSYRNAIVKFVASMYVGNIRDEKLTKESTDDHNINGKRLSVRKYLLQGSQLKEVVNSIQSARNFFNKNSLPWENDGERIIPAVRILDLKSSMEEKIRNIIDKREILITALDDIILNDKLNLGDTFNPSDYPSKDELRKKYDARMEIRPLATNFIVEGMEAGAQKIIQEEIEKSIQDTIKKSKYYQLEQLADSISHLAVRLSDPEKSFKGASIQNILDNSSSIRDLAIEDDSQMQEIAASVKETFSKLDADTLRENLTSRSEATKMAEEKLAKIKEMMSGFA
jgi:hypothetical protein